MAGATVNLATFSDADYWQAFRIPIDEYTYYDFTGCTLRMMVRKRPDDAEVFISLESNVVGYQIGESGIFLYNPELIALGDYYYDEYGYDEYGYEIYESAPLTEFSIIISRATLQRMPAGEYVHSLIVERPNGLRDDLWRGTLTHQIGPTR